ncbi:hypothetical protein [Paenibacillus tundrae]|uniref:Phage protein n=1 Tax=Paenibacillus tundrae TaxID=528187 RepID=A0ABT9W7D1_9BACL|nr:hypothetical protein [Paenibacillus tundrae]MDQ0169152.1 hypothetical protein [Paenibacillus tundrae]
MILSQQEIAFILFLRTLDFDDLSDACYGISKESKEARRNGIEQTYLGTNPVSAAGWIDRALKLDKLQELLGLANEDYRKMIDPPLGEEGEVLQ